MADNFDQFVIEVKLQTDKLNNQFKNLSDKFEGFSTDLGKKFDKSFDSDKLKKQMSRNESIIDSSAKNISKILGVGLSLFGVSFGTKFALDFIKGFASKGQNLQFLSQAFNTNPKQLQLLQQIYQRAGGSPESANAQVAQLYQRLTSGQLDQGLSSALKQLGIRVNGGKRDPVSIILEAIQKIGNSGFNNIQRGSLIQRLGLGAEGSTLTNQPELFTKYKKEVKDRNSFISDKDVEQAAELNKKLQDLSLRWDIITNTLMTKFVPTLEVFTNSIAKIMGIDIPKDSKTLKTVVDDIAYIFKTTNNKDFVAQEQWDKWKNSIANAETSGGLPNQIKKADKLGAYGTYGLRLSTGKDVLNRLLHRPDLAENLTADKLRENNYSLANSLSEIYFKNLIQKFGVEKGLEHYYGSKNPEENKGYADKVLHGGFNYQPKTNQIHGAVNHNQQVSYNLDNVHMHGVNNMQSFMNELNSLSQVAYNSSGNRLA